MMFAESFPVTVVAKQLDTATASEFQTLLNLLRSPDYIDEKLLKSELALLITKTLALLRSSDDEKVWRGCHVSVVICAFNPLVLCSHSGHLLAAIYSKLEQKVDYYFSTINTPHGKVLFEALVFAISSLSELMRDKPTLSRESLTPKLKVIIPKLITLAQYQPDICLPALKRLLYKSTTTFKPFVSKFRQIILSKICIEFEQYHRETQNLLCESYAYLHLIKIHPASSQDEASAHHKAYQDENWRIGLFSVLSHFKPIIELCGEILDLEQDKDLRELINSLKCDSFISEENKGDGLGLPGLKLDMNNPLTLWELPKRLNLLVDLLSKFITSPTPYPVRIPFGICIKVCEALLSMTMNYLPLRRDLRRDAQLTYTINKVIPQVQFCGIRLLSNMCKVYAKNCLSMIPSLLGSLEMFVPLLSKSTKVAFERCTLLKDEFLQLFQLINTLIPHMGHHFQEMDLITKLIDVALYLSQDIALTDSLFNQQLSDKKQKQAEVKRKQRKDNSLGAVSDLYTHPDRFNVKNIQTWHDEINIFLRAVLSNWRLPSNQQIKILKYSITHSLKLREELGYIPTSFVELLRTEVLYPGNERVSILPIAVSLIKKSNDDTFDTLCHPRLPLGIVHSVSKPDKFIEDSAEDIYEERDEIDDRNTITIASTQAIDTSHESGETQHQSESEELRKPNKPAVQVLDIDESLIFKKRSSDQDETDVEIIKRHRTAAMVPQSEAVIEKHEKDELGQHQDLESEEDGSEFEIPAIELSDDEDEE